MLEARLASEVDEAALMHILKENYAENGIGPLSLLLVGEAVLQGTRARGAIIGVVDGDNEIAGTVGLVFDSWWYSDPTEPGATLLRERWMYVRPAYRDGKCFDALWTFATGVADEMSREMGRQIPLLLGVMATDRVEAKLRLYSRRLPLAGGAFLYRPEV
jgi:hypothetical protein